VPIARERVAVAVQVQVDATPFDALRAVRDACISEAFAVRDEVPLAMVFHAPLSHPVNVVEVLPE
jgi:hypothetical protein